MKLYVVCLKYENNPVMYWNEDHFTKYKEHADQLNYLDATGVIELNKKQDLTQFRSYGIPYYLEEVYDGTICDCL